MAGTILSTRGKTSERESLYSSGQWCVSDDKFVIPNALNIRKEKGQNGAGPREQHLPVLMGGRSWR